ncbi:MAG: CPBP family intramembrane glutamic endopeptidase [Candidatus Bathyarchaeia archaeon]
MSFYAAEFVALWLYIKFVKKTFFSELFRRTGGWRRYCLAGFLLATLHNIIDLTVSIFIMGREHGFILPFYIHLPVYFLSYMFISISEEGVFRGCILGGLLNRHGVIFSIIFSSLLFGLYHFSYPSLFYGLSGAIMMATYIFQSFTAGLFLAYFYHKTGGSLVGPVSYHFSQMFFNIPYVWMEPASISFRVQPLLPEFWWLLQGTPHILNVIQILILRKIRF